MALLTTDALLLLGKGLFLYAGLIVAIGPQNLFVLQKGLQGRHLFATASVCSLADLLLIGAGVGGGGALLAANHTLATLTGLAGAGFLIVCALRSFRSALLPRTGSDNPVGGALPVSLKGTLTAACGFTFLNPAAYVDTLLMVGGTSAHFALDERLFFGVGAVLASVLWFFGLAYGANRLSALFQRPAAWRLLDGVSGAITLGIGASLAAPQLAWVWQLLLA